MNNSFVDEIESIEYFDEIDTIDIEVDRHNLFYANDILTHNSGMQNSEPDLTNTADSIGGPMTADLVIALITNEELAERGHLLIKILKSRYGDANKNNKFLLGIERSKMRLSDVSQIEQESLNEKVDALEIKKSIDNEFFKFD